jgi:hypothetical protein
MAAPARRLSTWTMTRDAITIGFDASGGFLAHVRGTTSPDSVAQEDVLCH